jgi:hypothetical protein
MREPVGENQIGREREREIPREREMPRERVRDREKERSTGERESGPDRWWVCAEKAGGVISGQL